MEVNAFLCRIREPINFLTQVGQLVRRHQTKMAIRLSLIHIYILHGLRRIRHAVRKDFVRNDNQRFTVFLQIIHACNNAVERRSCACAFRRKQLVCQQIAQILEQNSVVLLREPEIR